jgi:hypothetical protein
MDVQEVEIIINKNGQVQIQVRGVRGTQCLEITEELEQALGGKVTLRELTPEALEELQRSPRRVNIKGGK